MTEDQLQKIQDEIMQSIDGNLNKEQELISMAKEIAAKLTLGDRAVEEIDGRSLVFAYKTYEKLGRKCIFMTVADRFKFQVGLDKYKPYMVDVEIDNDFTLKENIQSAVEAFLRHIFDMVEAQEV